MEITPWGNPNLVNLLLKSWLPPQIVGLCQIHLALGGNGFPSHQGKSETLHTVPGGSLGF
jgi:hypothetical protein